MRTGRETWIGYVDEWLASGLRQAEFCRESGICYSSFNAWKRKLTVSQAPEAPVSTPVSVIEVSGVFANAGRPIRILVGQGLVIEVELGFCPSTLREVLAVVRGEC